MQMDCGRARVDRRADEKRLVTRPRLVGVVRSGQVWDIFWQQTHRRC